MYLRILFDGFLIFATFQSENHWYENQRYTKDLQERLFENEEMNFGILSIEFWNKHYQLHLGNM